MKEPVREKLGTQEIEIPPITGRRGLKAAAILLPYLASLKPVLHRSAEVPEGEAAGGGRGLDLLVDALAVLQPLIDPDAFLELGSCLSGQPVEALAEAPLEDTLRVTVRALAAVDLAAVLAAGAGVYAQLGRLGAAEAQPEPERAEEATTA